MKNILLRSHSLSARLEEGLQVDLGHRVGGARVMALAPCLLPESHGSREAAASTTLAPPRLTALCI